MLGLIVEHTGSSAETLNLQGWLKDCGCSRVSLINIRELAAKKPACDVVILAGLSEKEEAGFKVLDLIRERCSKNPAVIVVSHHGMQKVKDAAKARGADGFLITPVSESQFCEMVKNLTKNRRST